MDPRWAQLCERIGGVSGGGGGSAAAEAAPWLWTIIRALHEGSGRAYHNLTHVRACLDGLEAYGGPVADRDAIELALWLHDAIYDPRRGDNEARSADVAEMVVWRLGMDRPRRERVRGLVLATAHRGEFRGGDESVIADLDLGILGAPWPEYAAYAAAIRAEYAWADDESYRRGRGAFLRGMLVRPAIYHTEFMRQRHEAPARANMGRELAGMEAGSAGGAGLPRS